MREIESSPAASRLIEHYFLVGIDPVAQTSIGVNASDTDVSVGVLVYSGRFVQHISTYGNLSE